MSYSFYLDGTLLPVTPEAVSIAAKGRNETMVLMDQGEVNVLKTPGLTEISFDLLLPNVRYPFAVYPGGFYPAEYYLGLLERMFTTKRPFQFVISRQKAGGGGLFGTSLRVSLEEYTTKEDAGKIGVDVLASVKLKQYRDYGTKTCKISGNTSMIVAARETHNAPSGTSYIVRAGESLAEVAQRCYGDCSKYTQLQKANGVADPNRLKAGQQLVIPR